MADIEPVMNERTDVDAKATEILRIIEKYGINYERTGIWDGFETFLPVVKGQVERGESIKMLLPGFPFKSPNDKTKVFGKLPDLGEELALKRLDSIASSIEAIYPPGAEIHITSDGLVYNGPSPIPFLQPTYKLTTPPYRPPRRPRRDSLVLRPSRPHPSNHPLPKTHLLPTPLRHPKPPHHHHHLLLKEILPRLRTHHPHHPPPALRRPALRKRHGQKIHIRHAPHTHQVPRIRRTRPPIPTTAHESNA